MDSTVVLKFGGTSVGSPERMRAVAKIVSEHRAKTSRVVVVVSAMGETTDELIDLALKVSKNAQHPDHRREMDMLLSAGERISMALLALALNDAGVKALSFTGSQSGIITDTIHGEARIADIRPVRLRESLDQGAVVIVAGFQGVSLQKEITTLGRGGSDTSAVALAAALGASRAVIYTDVDGLFTADPRKVSSARKLDRVGWDTALLAAHFGAQVLHPRCVELAWKHSLPIELCSSFQSRSGTIIEGVDSMSLEGPHIMTVASQPGLKHASVQPLTSVEGAALLEKLRAQGVKVWDWQHEGTRLDVVTEESVLWNQLAPGAQVREQRVSRLSLVGAGLMHAPEIYSRFMGLLASEKAVATKIELQPTFLSAFVSASADLNSLVARAHQEFIRV
ncbi:MAG: aspartate kinase [Bdellovibrionales bacterium]|nr:aspartate kinase [Bdellovibrionales bacterium]